MTNREPDRDSDQRLLEAIQEFVAAHRDPALQRFQAGIAHWGSAWSGVKPQQLPAAQTLTRALAHTTPETHPLTALFERESPWRKWEQSYSKADAVVGEDMLAGYGFAEVIGKQGPFVSTRVRSGIGVWGPNIIYPPHRHQAEEVYLLLAGSAEFQLGEGEILTKEMRATGEAVQVPSMTTHGFRTLEEPLVVFYIWQAGDLREKSTFG